MIRFNTITLLKATAVAALACAPMALHNHGYVATMFLLPASFTFYALSFVERRGEFEVKFKKLPDSAVEIYLTGGRQGQHAVQNRIGGAGFVLAMGLGFAGVATLDEKLSVQALIVILLFLTIPPAICVTPRRMVRTKERQFTTDYLLFGRWRLWRCRWQVREGDSLTVFTVKTPEQDGTPEFAYQHMLCVCRGRRRHVIAIADFKGGRAVQGMEIVARRLAKLVDVPYSGYQEWKWFWRTS